MRGKNATQFIRECGHSPLYKNKMKVSFDMVQTLLTKLKIIKWIIKMIILYNTTIWRIYQYNEDDILKYLNLFIV